jgi:uncharacterized membrane protein (UPF0182 family)
MDLITNSNLTDRSAEIAISDVILQFFYFVSVEFSIIYCSSILKKMNFCCQLSLVVVGIFFPYVPKEAQQHATIVNSFDSIYLPKWSS